MYINFWYPMIRSDDPGPDKPECARVLGLNFAIFHDSRGQGDCRNIPSIGYGQKVPARDKVDAYPTVEKYGIVFAFPGDLPGNERPPLLDIEEYTDPAWQPGTQAGAPPRRPCGTPGKQGSHGLSLVRSAEY